MTKKMLHAEWHLAVISGNEPQKQKPGKLCMQTGDFLRAYRAFAAERKPQSEEVAAWRASETFSRGPFFEAGHRELAERLDTWAVARLAHRAHSEDRASVDAACRELVHELGSAGWTRYSVPYPPNGAVPSTPQFDVRALALIRETLAWYDGLADFAFAMQGLGSGAISLAGSPDLQSRYLPRVAAGEAIPPSPCRNRMRGPNVAAIQYGAAAARRARTAGRRSG